VVHENESVKKELADLKVELLNANQRVEEGKSAQKTLNKALEKLRTERFLLEQKLESSEQEHKQTIENNNRAIEELELKLKNAEKKVTELEEEAQEVEAGEGLDGIDIPLGEFTRNRMPSRSFRNSFQFKATSVLSGGPLNKSNMISAPKSGKDSGAASPNLVSKVKELEAQQEKLKETIASLKQEAETLSLKLKEETAKVEQSRIKAESRETELENLRKKIVYDCERYITSLNEANEEIDKRDNLIKSQQRQLRNITLSTPSAPGATQKPPLTSEQKKVASGMGKVLGLFK
jgi:chromosome segregation ATPase